MLKTLCVPFRSAGNYTGKASETGFLFTFANVTEGNYSILLNSTNDFKKETVSLSGTDATHHVQKLKPSTNYRVDISPSKVVPNVTCGPQLTLKTNDISK